VSAERSRKFFSGRSLAQAVAAAAHYFGVDPERIAYQVRDKRHGFVKVRRAVVIEVDPDAPQRAPGDLAPRPTTPRETAPRDAARREAGAPAAPKRGQPGGEGARPSAGGRQRERTEPRRPRREPRPAGPERSERPRRSARPPEAWQAPDEDAVLAATEGAARLLRLAGLDLEARVRAGAERLEVELEGADVGRLGAGFLDDFEHLLPRAGYGLSGRLVRARVEGGGLRARREEELRARAREAADRVLASGREELIDPLEPGERRIVHLELADRAGVATESVGAGALRRVRVYAAPEPSDAGVAGGVPDEEPPR
jgi:spoIIIJ-associated protein